MKFKTVGSGKWYLTKSKRKCIRLKINTNAWDETYREDNNSFYLFPHHKDKTKFVLMAPTIETKSEEDEKQLEILLFENQKN